MTTSNRNYTVLFNVSSLMANRLAEFREACQLNGFTTQELVAVVPTHSRVVAQAYSADMDASLANIAWLKKQAADCGVQIERVTMHVPALPGDLCGGRQYFTCQVTIKSKSTPELFRPSFRDLIADGWSVFERVDKDADGKTLYQLTCIGKKIDRRKFGVRVIKDMSAFAARNGIEVVEDYAFHRVILDEKH